MRRPGRGSGQGRPDGGHTLVEIVVVLGLAALLVANVVAVMRASQGVLSVGGSALELEDQARRTLDRIALAVMGASRDDLYPRAEFPRHTPWVRFRGSLGVQDGEPVWSDPERISHEAPAGEVVWTQRPGASDERRVVWSRWVRELLAGEVPNGVDDNGNGLVDESGLAFSVQGDLVTILLTLERVRPDGRVLRETLRTQVTMRQ